MPPASSSWTVATALALGTFATVWLALPTAPHGSKSVSPQECERGVLDAGQSGMNVLVYELCLQRLTIGFMNSEVIEELICLPSGEIELWMATDDARCTVPPAIRHHGVIELWEPLRGVGRTTLAPVRQLLTCRGDGTDKATIVVPHAYDAILETRPGDSGYERVTRRFVSGCTGPNA